MLPTTAATRRYASAIIARLAEFWVWLVEQYEKLPLIRPVRFVYFVSYTFGSVPGGPATLNGSGHIEVFMHLPIRSFDDVRVMTAAIGKASAGEDSRLSGSPESIIIITFKLLHKQVYRQHEWHNTRRHPQVA